MAKSILLVDDDEDILELLEYNLSTEGFEILKAQDGEEAMELATSKLPDLILLDIMLPEKDGLQIIRELRQQRSTRHIPVIFLTAKDSEVDEIVGLEMGADDYIVKPISIRKLVARVKAALRKPANATRPSEGILRFGELEIDPDAYQVHIEGDEVKFTKKEFEVLAYLASHPGRVITRENLLNEIWGYDAVVVDRTIDVHIRKIREKLGERYMRYVETIKGVGYRFKSEDYQ